VTNTSQFQCYPDKMAKTKAPAVKFDLAGIKELLVRFYADVMAVICSVMVVGYVWNSSSRFFAPFVVFQHNVTTGEDGKYYFFRKDIVLQQQRLCATHTGSVTRLPSRSSSLSSLWFTT
jgi:hypothetical protein